MRFFWPASSYDEQARDGGAIWPGQAFVEHHVLPPCGSGLTYIYIAWPSHHAGASRLSSPTAGDAGASSDLQENPNYAPSWGLPALQKVFCSVLIQHSPLRKRQLTPAGLLRAGEETFSLDDRHQSLLACSRCLQLSGQMLAWLEMENVPLVTNGIHPALQ